MSKFKTFVIVAAGAVGMAAMSASNALAGARWSTQADSGLSTATVHQL